VLPFIRGVSSLLVATLSSKNVRERLVYAVYDRAGVFPDRLRHHDLATCAVRVGSEARQRKPQNLELYMSPFIIAGNAIMNAGEGYGTEPINMTRHAGVVTLL
jgi:hypothetical protein